MSSNDYKQIILDLNYCLYSRLTSTVLFRDDCIVSLNPRNEKHQQSNLCYRIRLENINDLKNLVDDTLKLFRNVSCQPRYFIDELARPSLQEICKAFSTLYNVEADIDTDVIMSWTPRPNQPSIAKTTTIEYKLATMDILEDLVHVFAAAYGYSDDLVWLRYKLKTQLADPETFPIVYGESVDGDCCCAVVLHTPSGLPHLGHVNAVATHPDHQRQGYAAECLLNALRRSDNRKFYLEVYDDLYHVQRMYERIGFRKEGVLLSSTVAIQ
ncbi:MAG: hypothetical protein EXX96DRAFT_542025 [Benjaminiella poitrasii]|nr:MAG: hypothetical protein EXX96DRAFT_542025 [Benjaminiella poitrasii]